MAHARTSAAEPKPREPRPCVNGNCYHQGRPVRNYFAVGAGNVECDTCVAVREEHDKKIREDMLDMRGLPTKANTRPELKAWEL